MTKTSVETISSVEQWDSYLEDHPEATFYHLSPWKKLNEECFGHGTFYQVAKREGRTVGILPLVYLKSRLFGKILCSLPFVNYGGPCALDDEARSELIGSACNIVRENGMDYLELRSNRKLTTALPSLQHKVSMVKELDDDPDALWSNLSSKHRQQVRQAYKRGHEVSEGGAELLEDFYRVMSISWQRLGTPFYRKEYFESILAAFPQHISIFVTYNGSQAVAAAMNGHYKGIVEGMWLGTDWQYRKLQPTYVLYWEMIKRACEKGFRLFHFGRSTANSGGEVFKRKWRAEARQLYWHYYLGKASEVPSLNVNNRRYKALMGLWRRLPRRVTATFGPFLARSIP